MGVENKGHELDEGNQEVDGQLERRDLLRVEDSEEQLVGALPQARPEGFAAFLQRIQFHFMFTLVEREDKIKLTSSLGYCHPPRYNMS
ncbi:MAG: hypothetical protein P4M11_07740 [Candidatus Pacebacteria bacterium]|nr:hypothetical protein [Candidatus Paceibacterota bacterium]